MFNKHKIVCVVLYKYSKVHVNWQLSPISFNFELVELRLPPFLMVTGPRDRKHTDDERLARYAHLLSKSVNSKLPYGSIKAIAEEFNVHPRRYVIH